MMRAPLKQLSPLLLLSQLLGCGTEIGNPKRPSGTSSDNTQVTYLLSDTSVAGDVIAAQTDEVIDAIATESNVQSLTLGLTSNTSSTGSSGLSLVDVVSQASNTVIPSDTATSPASNQINSVCRPQATSTLVTVTADGADDHQFTHNGGSDTATETLHDNSTFTWTQSAGTAVPCDPTSNDVQINWANIAGTLNLSEVVSESLLSASITRHGRQGLVQRQTQYTLTGNRTASWTLDTANTNGTALMLDKVVLSAVDKSFNATTHSGGQVAVSTHIAVDPSNPLMVSVQRDPTTQNWVSKTILTGNVTTTQLGEQSFVVSTYTDVQFTVASGCVPVGGTITGNIYNSGDPTNPGTLLNQYQITFYQGAGTITYSDGSQADYVPDYCALDDTD